MDAHRWTWIVRVGTGVGVLLVVGAVLLLTVGVDCATSLDDQCSVEVAIRRPIAWGLLVIGIASTVGGLVLGWATSDPKVGGPAKRRDSPATPDVSAQG